MQLEVVREVRVILRALLQERIPPLPGLVGSVGQPGRFPGEYLLADQAIIDLSLIHI